MNCIWRFTRRFTDGAEERMQLAEDGEAARVVSTGKQRTAREAAASASSVVSDSTNVSILIERLMRGYDKRLRPNYKGIPTSDNASCLIG